MRRPLCVREPGRGVITGSGDTLDTLHQSETPRGQPCLACCPPSTPVPCPPHKFGAPRKFPNARMRRHNLSQSVISISGRAVEKQDNPAPLSPYSLHLLCFSPPSAPHHSSLATPYRHCVRSPKNGKRPYKDRMSDLANTAP